MAFADSQWVRDLPSQPFEFYIFRKIRVPCRLHGHRSCLGFSINWSQLVVIGKTTAEQKRRGHSQNLGFLLWRGRKGPAQTWRQLQHRLLPIQRSIIVFPAMYCKRHRSIIPFRSLSFPSCKIFASPERTELLRDLVGSSVGHFCGSPLPSKLDFYSASPTNKLTELLNVMTITLVVIFFA